MTSVVTSRDPWCQERLHRWAMWRMTVNQELIHGLDGTNSDTGGHTYYSFTNNYSLTQRYIQHPDVQKEETTYIRSNYGMPASPHYPMGNTLFFLYGLPRVSARIKVPRVQASQYSSMDNLVVPTTRPNLNKSESVRHPSSLPTHTKVQSRPQEVKHTTGRYHTNHDVVQTPRKMSPVNFRDKPEVDLTQTQSTKVNNINKPVLVPPSVFHSQALNRSNIDLPLNISGSMGTAEGNDVTSMRFEDPRVSRFNERPQKYVWGDMDIDEMKAKKPYVDESHLKTHV